MSRNVDVADCIRVRLNYQMCCVESDCIRVRVRGRVYEGLPRSTVLDVTGCTTVSELYRQMLSASNPALLPKGFRQVLQKLCGGCLLREMPDAESTSGDMKLMHVSPHMTVKQLAGGMGAVSLHLLPRTYGHGNASARDPPGFGMQSVARCEAPRQRMLPLSPLETTMEECARNVQKYLDASAAVPVPAKGARKKKKAIESTVCGQPLVQQEAIEQSTAFREPVFASAEDSVGKRLDKPPVDTKPALATKFVNLADLPTMDSLPDLAASPTLDSAPGRAAPNSPDPLLDVVSSASLDSQSDPSSCGRESLPEVEVFGAEALADYEATLADKRLEPMFAQTMIGGAVEFPPSHGFAFVRAPCTPAMMGMEACHIEMAENMLKAHTSAVLDDMD